MDKMALCRPFSPEQIKQRPGRNGQMLSYVETHAVISRLNEACERWDLEIVRHEIHEDEVIVVARLCADGTSKMAFGGSRITVDNQGRVVSLADDLKAAASDALKKCASLLGVALELYGAPALVQAASDSAVSRHDDKKDQASQRISAKQLAWITAICRRLGVSRNDLVTLVQQKTGKDKLELLSKREASDMIEYFQSVAPAA